MNQPFRDLQLQQMDESLAPWRSAPLSARPRAGWARAIREALGMSGYALARRMGITPAGVRKLEAAESADAITLASLRKLAQALDCELHYALVPRSSLTQRIEDQARAVAQEHLRPVSHSMALEDQAVQEAGTRLQVDLAARELLAGSRRALW